jgi:hypothetical protein
MAFDSRYPMLISVMGQEAGEVELMAQLDCLIIFLRVKWNRGISVKHGSHSGNLMPGYDKNLMYRSWNCVSRVEERLLTKSLDK